MYTIPYGLLDFIFEVNSSLASENVDVGKVLKKAQKELDTKVMCLDSYDVFSLRLNKAHHNLKNNISNSVDSKGCGCKLCVSRHEYVKLKRSFKYYRECLEGDYYPFEHFVNISEKLLGDAYDEDVSCLKTYETCKAIFKSKIDEQKNITRSLIKQYQNIKGTAENLLCSRIQTQ